MKTTSNRPWVAASVIASICIALWVVFKSPADRLQSYQSDDVHKESTSADRPPIDLNSEWVAHSIDSRGRGADGVRLLDVNGDGRLDIASGWEEARETRVYLHPGDAEVRQAWPSVVVGSTGPVEDAVFSDLDADGFYDVLSASEDRNIYVHWAPQSHQNYLTAELWKGGTIPAAYGLQRWMMTVPAEINDTYGPDFFAAGKGTEIVYFESPPDPRALDQWKMHVISELGGWTMGLLAVDMDGDGDQDALVSVRDQNPGVSWLENPGSDLAPSGLWRSHRIGGNQPSGFVHVADLNRDGFQDVVAPTMGAEGGTLRVFYGLATNGREWREHEISLSESFAKGIAAGDIFRDGNIDLVVSNEYASISILRSTELGGWGPPTAIAHGEKFDDVTLYDIDADGDLDVLTTDERGLQVVWFENPDAQ